MDAIRKIEAALAAGPSESRPWELWTSNSYRRIPGAIEPTIQRSDNHPDLHATIETLEYVVACQPSAIREVLQTLASKEAELSNAALNYVSLFGELQNAQEEIARLREVLQDIADDTNPDNENSYRADDPEGCLDATHANAIAAIKQPTE